MHFDPTLTIGSLVLSGIGLANLSVLVFIAFRFGRWVKRG